MIRVVVIDDSAFMRKALCMMLEKDPEIKIVGTARDGEEGFNKVVQTKPDVVTLDIEMPRTNGLDCLRMIMENKIPTQTLVVSSITTKGAETTLKALDLGAADYISKTQSFVALDIIKIEDELLRKVKAVAKKARKFAVKRHSLPRQEQNKSIDDTETKQFLDLQNERIACVAIGVSTGGPPVVQELLMGLPQNYPVPIIIAQHMPKEFTPTFAKRLNSVTSINVKEAEAGENLVPGTAYIGRGGMHLILSRKGIRVPVTLSREPNDLLYHPSADVMFNSAVEVYGSRLLGVILTGMGKDGSLGLQNLHNRKGNIIAQNEESCIVYGMPKAVVDAGIANAVLPIAGITKSLQTIVR